MMRLISTILFLFPFCLLSQLITNIGSTPAGLVQNVLLGPGVKVSNITFTGSPQAIGSFTANNTNLGITEGIVITTGTVLSNTNGPQGPNNSGSSGVDNNRPGAAILNSISSSTTFNAAVLEFDFTAVGDSVSFNYVFGSEEYIEYVDIGNPQAFNDVFGLFISGPLIPGGTQNIAKLPNGQVVSINNVNHLSNTNYYVNNGDGTQEPFVSSSNYIQYDGFTKVLTASSAVQCGQTYHLTIAIADVGDGILDSGIFLQAQSLESKPLYEVSHTISQEHFGNDTEVAEGCTSATFTITREDNSTSVSIPIQVAGNATENTDYGDVPPNLTFNVGDNSVNFDMDIFGDAIVEGNENIQVIFMLPNECGDIIPDTVELVIRNIDPIQVSVADDTLYCGPGLKAILRPIVTGGLEPITYLWDTGATSDTLVVSPTSTQSYSVTVTDFCLNSTATDVAQIVVPAIPPILVEPIDDIFESCPNTPTTVEAIISGGSGNYTYSWRYKNQEISTQNPTTLSPTITSVFQLIVSDGCGLKDTISINFNVTVPVLIPKVNDPSILCPGDSIELQASATLGSPPYTFLWPHSGETTPSVWVRPTANTNYTVEVTDACQTYSVNATTNVSLHQPEVNFDILAPSLNAGVTIQFINKTVDGVSYFWDLGNGQTSTDLNPSSTYNSIDVYTITLISLDSHGCYDTISKEINIGHVLYIPNTFTPDGNKFNNEFFPVYMNIEIIEFEIFNRWGELVFSGKEQNNRFKWNGNYKGKPCPDGIYTYKIRYINPSSEELELVGHVNLLR